MAKKLNLKWNVFYEDLNARKIKVYNIFDHCSYREEVERLLYSSDVTDEEFAKKLKSYTMYWFWAKAEWEVIISSWLYFESPEYKKVDVWWQIEMNWDRFLEYVSRYRENEKV